MLQGDRDTLNEYVPAALRHKVRHYHGDHWATPSFEPSVIAQLMYAGFLPIATMSRNNYYLLPKLHMQRCVMDPRGLHTPKQIRKKAKGYRLTVNGAFDDVVRGCHVQHGEAWLYPPVVAAFRAMTAGVSLSQYSGQGHGGVVRIVSVELWTHNDTESSTLVAGELGYTNGAMYTSLTGFISPGTKGAGTMQLHALGALLHLSGFQLWDFGMSMAYKLDLGASNMPRETFLQKVGALRSMPLELKNLGNDGQQQGRVHDLLQQHRQNQVAVGDSILDEAQP
ncbi:Aste57867_11969 [Aphanomyces stellatus]|uniref:Aste57867_11969 protein n=1 Tax=Aphanomyces stellatus TaxID=120398 RepID=A0A485KUD6_9STRA|nr:hypothetical protein As57867_011924 [Aphanomyces stellatus]VFT88824.1 Aste57867_11969 [Aphanomyces stellatus]